jgi:uncharacterized iron-regulated membrane protein
VKALFLWFHKWLGLITGIVVFLVSITGCIYVFHDDLKVLFYPEKYYTEGKTNNHVPLPLHKLIAAAQAGLETGESVSRVDIYPATGRTWTFRALKVDENAFGHWNYHVYNKRVFVDPYTGKIQAIENSKTEFFQLMLQLHMNLLLGKKVGHAVVAYSTVIFIVLVLTGLILWWPKTWTKRNVKKSLQLDFKLKWKRINYDLHNVLGFYTMVFALIFAVTGLIFSFPKFKSFYTDTFNKISVFNSKNEKPSVFPFVAQSGDNTLDNALFFALQEYPDADMMSIRLRGPKEEFHDIQIRLKEGRSGVFRWYYFKQSDGQISTLKSSEGLALGDKLASVNYDIHVGSIGGWPTKILAFIFSLICASLPVTGFLIWWYKHKKKEKKRSGKKQLSKKFKTAVAG